MRRHYTLQSNEGAIALNMPDLIVPHSSQKSLSSCMVIKALHYNNIDSRSLGLSAKIFLPLYAGLKLKKHYISDIVIAQLYLCYIRINITVP